MLALILAAGYATRMYPLTLNKPKPLLSIAGKPAIEHIIERIRAIKEVARILVITNAKFFQHFQDWKKTFSEELPIKILNDQSLSEQDRLGAVGDIDFVLKQEKVSQDLLVIAGDNLFQGGLREFIDFARNKAPASSIGLHKLNNLKQVKKYSQVRLDAEQRIIEFEEKPQRPSSTLVAKCIYFFPAEKLHLIAEYIKTGGSTDQPGHYISWLYRQDKVFGFIFSGRWYDIGDAQTYQKASDEFGLE
ncbi:MAG: nucleotidyltransferase family protein [Candidatus Omnitrophica bacterium]|nr:nucleotidyltransferase family protein [Candidatus Omnitrophota bacterium]